MPNMPWIISCWLNELSQGPEGRPSSCINMMHGAKRRCNAFVASMRGACALFTLLHMVVGSRHRCISCGGFRANETAQWDG